MEITNQKQNSNGFKKYEFEGVEKILIDRKQKEVTLLFKETKIQKQIKNDQCILEFEEDLMSILEIVGDSLYMYTRRIKEFIIDKIHNNYEIVCINGEIFHLNIEDLYTIVTSKSDPEELFNDLGIKAKSYNCKIEEFNLLTLDMTIKGTKK